jgi:hypothetical protein
MNKYYNFTTNFINYPASTTYLLKLLQVKDRFVIVINKSKVTKYYTLYNVTIEESSLCGTRSPPRSEENTLPMSLK